MAKPIKFGKYLLLKRLAAGGMAEVFQAKLIGDQGFEKLVVIKRMLPHLTEEEQMVKFFIDEARLAAQLKHENIIHIYDFGNVNGSFYIAMEYLFGKDLQAILLNALKSAPPLDLPILLYIVSKICEGLDYAHQLKDLKDTPLNIIHRDISPQNVFITYEGQVKIIDFGIAKAASHSSKTRVGVIKGKVAYMSPEQAEGKPIDHRSDIYAVGIIFYELLAKKRLFEGDTFQVLTKVRESKFEPLESIVPDLPGSLYGIVNRALSKNPENRYLSCEEMRIDIEDCMDQLKQRGNPKKLSEYLQLVFANEYAMEKAELSEAISYAAPAPDTDENEPQPAGDSFEETEIIDSGDNKTLAMESPETSAADHSAVNSIPFFSTIRHFRRRLTFAVLAISVLSLTVGATAYYFFHQRMPLSSAHPEQSQTGTFWTMGKTATPTKREEIEKWLELAESSLRKYHLTDPQNDCAYYYYMQVLKQEADNPQAKEGLLKVASAYAGLAEKEMNRLNRGKALNFIQAGLAIDPGNQRLLALKKDASNEGTMFMRKLKHLF